LFAAPIMGQKLVQTLSDKYSIGAAKKKSCEKVKCGEKSAANLIFVRTFLSV
jgi:hypothetical protein